MNLKLLMISFLSVSSAFGEEQVFVGIYTSGFEKSEFIPCESDERYWAHFEDDELANYYKDHPEACTNMECRPLSLKVRGLLSEKKASGHMGMYDRELVVNKILARGSGNREEVCKIEKK